MTLFNDASFMSSFIPNWMHERQRLATTCLKYKSRCRYNIAVLVYVENWLFTLCNVVFENDNNVRTSMYF